MDRVHQVSSEVLPALGQVRFAAADSLGDPENLHRTLRTLVTDAMRKASTLDFSQREVDDIGYVLAALVDEVAILAGGPVLEYWLGHKLQLELFNTATAGEGVFERLEALISDPGRIDVLAIYYLAILFGFQGKYGVRGRERELLATMERVETALRRGGRLPDPVFDPPGARPPAGGSSAQTDRSLFRTALGALAIALVVYLVMFASLAWRTGNVASGLEESTTEFAKEPN